MFVWQLTVMHVLNYINIRSYSLCVASVPPFSLRINANSKKSVIIVQKYFFMTRKLDVTLRLLSLQAERIKVRIVISDICLIPKAIPFRHGTTWEL